MAIKLSKNGKRLGRPPKNASKQSTGATFITDVKVPVKKEVTIQPPENAENGIECEFIQINQYSHLNTEDKKCGRYLMSVYNFEGFGKNKWVVAGYLKADWEKYKILRWHESEVVKRCVNYLNSITVNKRGKKKYGNLEMINFNFIEKFGQRVAVVEMAIDERKNENFWGEGDKL